MKLTDNEKREILNHLEKDRPLPDKYRFLLFDDKREVELIWNGKSNEVTNIVLPFQVIEQVDEPRAEKLADTALQLDLFDTRGRQKSGWTNKLIWGDNKLILSSLKNGAMSEEIEKNGGIKLIYIDPPFDVGADFSMDIEIGDETFTKRPNVLEELAYRDTWGKGADSFIAMIYERLILMRDLLADDGSIYVHCDYRVNNYLRLVLDEIFGKSGFKNEIIWYYETYQGAVKTYYPRKHDVIFFYTKSNNYKFDLQYIGNPEDSINFKRWEDYIVDGNKIKGSNYPKTDSRFTIRLDKWIRDNGRNPNDDDVIFEIKTMAANSVWRDIKPIDPKDLSKKIDYPTQKPEPLIERIINASTNENDIVADFFAGSGTTLAVAEKLNRKWIGSDLGKFAVHTTRKRMIGVQRELKAAGKDFRAFEILNLGKYERAHYIGYTPVASLLRNDKESVISTEGRNPDPAQKDFSVASLLRNDKESVISTEGRNPDPAQKDFSVASLPRNDKESVISTEGRNPDPAQEDFSVASLPRNDKESVISTEGRNPDPAQEDSSLSLGMTSREEIARRILEQKEKDFIALILRAYRAEALEGFRTFHGKKSGRMVTVGPVNLPVTRLFVEEIILECRQKRISRVDVLAFEFEMGLFPNVQEEAKSKGIDLALKYIPREVFDKRAVEKNQVVFHDVSYIEVKPLVAPLASPHSKKGMGGTWGVAVELTDFSVFYSQDSVENASAALKNGGNKIVVENGKIIKVSKDQAGIVTREVLTKKWTDWIDYWAVDFDFENKREIIRVRTDVAPGEQIALKGMENPQAGLPLYEEIWTGDFIFENEWQSFRTKKDRSLELKTPPHEAPPGRRKIAVKVVDIFGNDTMKILEVTVGK